MYGPACVNAAHPSQPLAPRPPSPSSWPVNVTLDNTTHGAWVSAGYGHDGYALFAFDRSSNGTLEDRVSLPPYIASVSLPAGVSRSLSANASEAAALLQVSL